MKCTYVQYPMVYAPDLDAVCRNCIAKEWKRRRGEPDDDKGPDEGKGPPSKRKKPGRGKRSTRDDREIEIVPLTDSKDPNKGY